MADSDKRLDAVEDELKLLKGEVKRTLVDLWALIMKEDSPLQDNLDGLRNKRRNREEPSRELLAVTDAETSGLERKKMEALEEEIKSLREGALEQARALASAPGPQPGPAPGSEFTPHMPGVGYPAPGMYPANPGPGLPPPKPNPRGPGLHLRLP